MPISEVTTQETLYFYFSITIYIAVIYSYNFLHAFIETMMDLNLHDTIS
jgi:hypothetical protein